nr:MFS transporter [Nocardioides sp. zg-DK7169]
MRPAAVSVGPVLDEVRDGLGMSAAAAGLLTSLPVLAFAGFGAVAPALARRAGIHRVTLGALVAVVAGLAGRVLVDQSAPFLLLSMLALAGMAAANVLLPSLVKLHFPHRVGAVTAMYTTALAIGLTASLVLTVPISEAADSWRVGLGTWAVLALLAALPWLGLIAHDRTPEAAPQTIRFLDVARTPIGWAMALFFGLQSIQAYVVFGWFPTLWRDAGYSATAAGLLVGVVAAVSIPLSLWLPRLVARTSRTALLVLSVIACYPLGYLALLVAPYHLAVPAALLVGTGASIFPVVLTLIGLRSRTPAGTAALSGFTQSAGYLLAGIGPFGFGLIHDLSGGWTVPLLVLLAMLVPLALVAAYAARPAHVEDQLPGVHAAAQ